MQWREGSSSQPQFLNEMNFPFPFKFNAEEFKEDTEINDQQLTALNSVTNGGSFDRLPSSLQFSKLPQVTTILQV